MAEIDVLKRILEKEYGITTYEELSEELKNSQINISVFTEKGSDNECAVHVNMQEQDAERVQNMKMNDQLFTV